jgi:predicted TIM-barrel fold metal-dependent hydrolase
MSGELNEIPIVDIDSHFTEPPDFWTKRAPAKFRDRAPRVITGDNGVQRWVVDNDIPLGPPGFCVIRKDGSKAYGVMTLDRFDEMHPGASYVEPRLGFLESHGISQQILYPNTLGFAGSMIMGIKDEALRTFCTTAYNDGVADLQNESGRRLIPQAALPFWNIESAVKELIRSHDDLGLTGCILTDAPENWGLPDLIDPYWTPLFAAAEERGMPINFHIGGGHFSGAPWGGGASPTATATMSSLAFMGNVRCVANLIFSGLLDRFPSLNFVSVESGLGWIPFLLEFCEYQFDENAVTSLELRPREYFARQIYASYWFERDPVNSIRKLPEDNIMFETDFPHPTCLYPGIREHIKETLGGLPFDMQKKILRETATRVYNLPEVIDP